MASVNGHNCYITSPLRWDPLTKSDELIPKLCGRHQVSFFVGLVNISNWIKAANSDSSSSSSSSSSSEARPVDDKPSTNEELIKLQKETNMLKVLIMYLYSVCRCVNHWLLHYKFKYLILFC